MKNNNKLNDVLLGALIKGYGINIKDSLIITVEAGGKNLSIQYPEGVNEFEDRAKISFSDCNRKFKSLNAFYLEASRQARRYDKLWKYAVQPKYFAKRVFLRDEKFHDMPAERKLLQKTEGSFKGEKCEIEIQKYWPMDGNASCGPIGVSLDLRGEQFFAEELTKENVIKNVTDYLGMKGLLKEVVDDTPVKIEEVPDFLREIKAGKLIMFREQFPSKTERKEGWMDITKNLSNGKNYSYISLNSLIPGQAMEIIRKISPIVDNPSGFSLEFSVWGSSENHYHSGNFPDSFYEL